MRRAFLDGDAQSRYTDARFEAITTIGAQARAHGAAFVVVAGDVFETNHVDRRTVARAADVLAGVGLPVWLLPGNHDPLDAASVYRRSDFLAQCPANVHVLDRPGPVEVHPGVHLYAAPWPTKRPARDLAAPVLEALPPADGTLRILVAHGALDALAPDNTDPARLRLGALEGALSDGRLHYVALGDRHSATAVGASGRVRYAGTPEVTDFDEVRPGRALLVDLGEDGCEVAELHVGKWQFVRDTLDLAGAEPVSAVREWLDDIGDKRRTVVRLSLVGTLSLRERAELDQVLALSAERFAAVDQWQATSDLAVRPDDGDLAALSLSGFADEAFRQLLDEARGRGEDAGVARDALALLYRLAKGAPA